MKKALLSLAMLCAVMSAPAVIAADAEDLFVSKSCVACHNQTNKLVGPSFTEVAATGKDAATLVNSIMNGSQGVYGPMPMPPNNVTEAEATVLAEWILTHK